MKRDIRLERHYPVPPERLWQALTDARELSAWFMPTDFEPELGRAFTFRMKPQRGWDGVTHCEVVELIPGRSVAFTYRGHASGEKPIACAGVESNALKSTGRGLFFDLDTVLRFDLTPEHSGTRLSLHHSGFNGFKLVLVSFIMGYGWKRSVLPRLDRLLSSALRA